jgi:hypothetical protein
MRNINNKLRKNPRILLNTEEKIKTTRATAKDFDLFFYQYFSNQNRIEAAHE